MLSLGAVLLSGKVHVDMTKFTAVIDESGSPSFPVRTGDEYFSVGVLIPQSPDNLRERIVRARVECPDERVKQRGFFHARQDGRNGRRFLANQLHGIGFHFKMLFADKRAADQFHKVNKPRHFHRILLREAIKYGITNHCRQVDLLVGLQTETLKSARIVEQVLEYHDSLQILEAIRFPGNTVRTKVDNIRMVTPRDEPLMDIVDYLTWAHQREELRDDEAGHQLLGANMSRTSIGGAQRFPGVARIYTCSTWLPTDAVLSRKFLPYIEATHPSPVLPKVLTELDRCIKDNQINPALYAALDAGSKIEDGDRRTDTILRFGEAIFEVIDTEGMLLTLTESEFCELKKGSAVCCWLRKRRMHVPPVDHWDLILESFMSLVTGQKALQRT